MLTSRLRMQGFRKSAFRGIVFRNYLSLDANIASLVTYTVVNKVFFHVISYIFSYLRCVSYVDLSRFLFCHFYAVNELQLKEGRRKYGS